MEIFLQSPACHLYGYGCKKCNLVMLGNPRRKLQTQFIIEAKEIHGKRYSYKKVIYKGHAVRVIITCRDHGDFLQTPAIHLNGSGCPKCRNSKMEDQIYQYLLSQDCEYTTQVRFDGCQFIKQLSFDFIIKAGYFPGFNWLFNTIFGIETDGIQHTQPIKRFSSLKKFIKQIKCDMIKNKYCRENGIALIRIPHTVKNIVDFLINRLENWTKEQLDAYNIQLEKQQLKTLKKCLKELTDEEFSAILPILGIYSDVCV